MDLDSESCMVCSDEEEKAEMGMKLLRLRNGFEGKAEFLCDKMRIWLMEYIEVRGITNRHSKL